MNGTSTPAPSPLRFAIPKGRMQENVKKLLSDCGIQLTVSDRGYRPTISLDNVAVKLLKPQNIIEMLHAGSRDVGFGGADWVENLNCTNLVDLLDTKMDPVKIVLAGPSQTMLDEAIRTGKHLTIASEYEKLTKVWIASKKLNATFVRAYGATESFPPEDADLIVDNTATGSTLKANGLEILDVVYTSSTHLYANKDSYADPLKRKQIDELVLLLKSALFAREKCMVSFNVTEEQLETLVNSVPCMRAPSVQQLHHNAGFAIQVCVDRKDIAQLLPRLKQQGATDIIVSKVEQIIA